MLLLLLGMCSWFFATDFSQKLTTPSYKSLICEFPVIRIHFVKSLHNKQPMFASLQILLRGIIWKKHLHIHKRRMTVKEDNLSSVKWGVSLELRDAWWGRERVSKRKRGTTHICVQLAHKAWEIVVLEVLRQQILWEFWGIPHNKAVVALAPGHYCVGCSIINHVVGLCKKRWRCIALQAIRRRLRWCIWEQRDLRIHPKLSRNHTLP